MFSLNVWMDFGDMKDLYPIFCNGFSCHCNALQFLFVDM